MKKYCYVRFVLMVILCSGKLAAQAAAPVQTNVQPEEKLYKLAVPKGGFKVRLAADPQSQDNSGKHAKHKREPVKTVPATIDAFKVVHTGGPIRFILGIVNNDPKLLQSMAEQAKRIHGKAQEAARKFDDVRDKAKKQADNLNREKAKVELARQAAVAQGDAQSIATADKKILEYIKSIEGLMANYYQAHENMLVARAVLKAEARKQTVIKRYFDSVKKGAQRIGDLDPVSWSAKKLFNIERVKTNAIAKAKNPIVKAWTQLRTNHLQKQIALGAADQALLVKNQSTAAAQQQLAAQGQDQAAQQAAAATLDQANKSLINFTRRQATLAAQINGVAQEQEKKLLMLETSRVIRVSKLRRAHANALALVAGHAAQQYQKVHEDMGKQLKALPATGPEAEKFTQQRLEIEARIPGAQKNAEAAARRSQEVLRQTHTRTLKARAAIRLARVQEKLKLLQLQKATIQGSRQALVQMQQKDKVAQVDAKLVELQKQIDQASKQIKNVERENQKALQAPVTDQVLAKQWERASKLMARVAQRFSVDVSQAAVAQKTVPGKQKITKKVLTSEEQAQLEKKKKRKALRRSRRRSRKRRKSRRQIERRYMKNKYGRSRRRGGARRRRQRRGRKQKKSVNPSNIQQLPAQGSAAIVQPGSDLPPA